MTNFIWTFCATHYFHCYHLKTIIHVTIMFCSPGSCWLWQILFQYNVFSSLLWTRGMCYCGVMFSVSCGPSENVLQRSPALVVLRLKLCWVSWAHRQCPWWRSHVVTRPVASTTLSCASVLLKRLWPPSLDPELPVTSACKSPLRFWYYLHVNRFNVCVICMQFTLIFVWCLCDFWCKALLV